ncbi:MAG TPA: DNA topoisomerase IB [Verrucomicrobiae bacterium]
MNTLGIHRSHNTHSPTYTQNGKLLHNLPTLTRIKSLAIPPAWRDVWINPSPTAPLQATGRDARGRKQYIYHPDWRASRERHKYRRILRFATQLPHIRRRVRHDLKLKTPTLLKVQATIVSLLDRSLIRIGNPEYARQNRSYGLTTLRDSQVSISAHKIAFHFRGKSKKIHDIELKDRKLAGIVRQCRDLPGEHLFQYLDEDGNRHKITSSDVNHYLRELSDAEFSAKDFRTWSATVLMISELLKTEPCTNISATKRTLKACLSSVAERLGNTPAICRKSYIHPIILKTYLSKNKLPSLKNTGPIPRGFTKPESTAFHLLTKLLRKRVKS